MNVMFYDEGPKLTEKDLDTTEAAIGCKFPQSYRAHLLKHNGGAPDPSWFRIRWSGQSWAEGWDKDSVEYFLSLDPGDATDFMDYHTTFVNRIPSDTVVIAFDPGGNLILLGIGSGNAGKVYFWMHNYEADEIGEADYSNVGFVADSIEEMIENLFDGETE